MNNIKTHKIWHAINSDSVHILKCILIAAAYRKYLRSQEKQRLQEPKEILS